MDVDNICKRIHEIVFNLPKCTGQTLESNLPENGVYFFFEEGEIWGHGGACPRIVRVGSHREQERFRERIINHYRGNQNTSVFRQHLGEALIFKENLGESMLKEWYRNTPASVGVGRMVTEQLNKRFHFRWIQVNDRKERRDLEERLISTLAKCPVCKPSPNWLGLYDYVHEKVRESGLWNEQHVNSPNLMTEKHLGCIRM